MKRLFFTLLILLAGQQLEARVLSYKQFLKNRMSHSLWMYKPSGNYRGPTRFDHKLKKYLRHPYGVFIEVGAHNGCFQSNTKIFEDLYGWTGLLIEPGQGLYKKCLESRPYSIVENCALVSFDYPDTHILGDFDDSPMSSVEGKRLNRNASVRVPAVTLTALLEKHQIEKVDFFSLDVEGYELEVLKGLDFEKVAPTYMLIEVYRKDLVAIKKFIEDKEYVLVENFCTGLQSFDFPAGYEQCDLLFRHRQ